MMKHNRKLQECNLNKTLVFLLNWSLPAAGLPLPLPHDTESANGSGSLLRVLVPFSGKRLSLVGIGAADTHQKKKNEGNFPVHPSGGCLKMSYSGLGRNFMQISHTIHTV